MTTGHSRTSEKYAAAASAGGVLFGRLLRSFGPGSRSETNI